MAFQPNMGIEVDPIDLEFFVPEGATVYRLGRGEFGGEVFRISFVDGQSFVYKYYDYESDARDDFEKLEVMYKLAKKSYYLGLKVVKPLSLNGRLMKLEYVVGETLKKVLEMGNSYLNIDLTKIYEAQVNQTRIWLEEHYGRPSQLHPDAAFDFEFSDKTVYYYLHKGNVLLTSRGLVVIDPN